MKLKLAFGKESYDVDIPPDATISSLQEHIEILTELPVRKQKILFKGKTISQLPKTSTLQAAGIVDNGSKLMLIAAAGAPSLGPQQSKGQAALAEQRRAKATEIKERLQQRAEQRGVITSTSNTNNNSAAGGLKARLDLWKKLKIVACRDLKLETVPEEVFSLGDANIRVLDLGCNQLQSISTEIHLLTTIQKLNLSFNQLTEDSIPWDALTALSQLQILALDNNKLTSIPSCIGGLTSLRKLTLANNRLHSLPVQLGMLSELRALSVRKNMLTRIPAGLESLTLLEEIDFSDNKITEIPAELRSLVHLNYFYINNNKLSKIPKEILLECLSLHTLSIHGNPITADQFRDTPGYAEFDARRRAKYDKQLDRGVLLGRRGLDEGVDIDEFSKW